MANIPIDLAGVSKAAEQAYEAILSFCDKKGVSRFNSIPVAALCYALVVIPLFLIAAAVQGVLGLGTMFATGILGVIGQVRTQNASDFNEVIAAAMSELLGVEISADALPGGQGPGGITERMKAIGGALHSQLQNEFGLDGPVSPEDGVANAKAFSGFGINFATGSAFISILSEACSLGFLKEFRELGEATAEAIGLGRLQRLALQPLLKNAVQTPSDRYYMKICRPTQMSEAQIVQAVRSGGMTEDAARDQLAQKGYRDEDIAILLDQLTAKISAGELEKLIRYNVMDLQHAIDRLTNLGMDQADAQLILAAADEARGDSQVSTILSNLEKARLDGFIDQNEFSSLLDELPLGTEEERLFRKRVADQLERPRTTISFAELKTAVVKGITDFSYVDTWLQNKGYGDTDQLILTFEIIEALATADAKKAAKAAKAAALQAAGKPVPAALTA